MGSRAPHRQTDRKYRATRALSVACARLEADDQVETALEPAEVRLIAHDAGSCTCGTAPGGF